MPWALGSHGREPPSVHVTLWDIGFQNTRASSHAGPGAERATPGLLELHGPEALAPSSDCGTGSAGISGAIRSHKIASVIACRTGPSDQLTTH